MKRIGIEFDDGSREWYPLEDARAMHYLKLDRETENIGIIIEKRFSQEGNKKAKTCIAELALYTTDDKFVNLFGTYILCTGGEYPFYYVYSKDKKILFDPVKTGFHEGLTSPVANEGFTHIAFGTSELGGPGLVVLNVITGKHKIYNKEYWAGDIKWTAEFTLTYLAYDAGDFRERMSVEVK